MDLQLHLTTTIMSFIVVDLQGNGGTMGESVASVEIRGIPKRYRNDISYLVDSRLKQKLA